MRAARLIAASALAIVGICALAACSTSASTAGPTESRSEADTSTPTAAVTSPMATATPPATALPTVAAPTLTPTPTTTPLPTSTPVPQVEAGQITTEFGVSLLRDQPECSPLLDRRDDYPPRLERVCASGIEVTSPADGIVIGLGHRNEERDGTAGFNPAGAPASKPSWAWSDLHAMGHYVIIDHGLRGFHGNVTSVIWNMDPTPDLTLGLRLSSADSIGISVADQPISWQLWTGADLFDTTEPAIPSPPFEEALAVAEGLSPLMAPPVAAPCTVDFALPSDLPNAGRPYRSGIHQGVDMICGAPGSPAFAALDGAVIAVVNDYQDSPVQPRLDVLTNAAIGGGTPHWTLNLLFGNFVVIEHVDPDGREVLTFSAHLDSVEPGIVVGAQISAGALLGVVGNRGTGPSAAGTTQAWDRSRHLHWEFFVDGTWLGAGLDTAQTAAVYRTLLCGAAAMNGC